jgi:hypothetical protein
VMPSGNLKKTGGILNGKKVVTASFCIQQK